MNMQPALIVLFLLLQNSGTIFEIDLTPYEHTWVFEAVATQLQLHELPYTSSRISKPLKVSRGQRIPFDDERYRTIRAGRIRALMTSRVMGRIIGKVDHLSREDYYSYKYPEANIQMNAGATFDYLQYRAEGSCFVRIHGDVVDCGCPIFDKSKFRLEAEPKVQLWIHAVVGEARGWLMVTNSILKDVGRE